MKKDRIGIALLLCLVVILSGCKKEPINSTVEGHWILEKFTTLKDNKTIYCDRLFYGITRMVTEVAQKQSSQGKSKAYIATTEYQKNETVLVLRNFKVRFATSDSKISATKEQLRPFGINNPQKTIFEIVKASHEQLILESDYARLVLKRF